MATLEEILLRRTAAQDDEIRRLIRDLGNEDIGVRDSAHLRLIEIIRLGARVRRDKALELLRIEADKKRGEGGFDDERTARAKFLIIKFGDEGEKLDAAMDEATRILFRLFAIEGHQFGPGPEGGFPKVEGANEFALIGRREQGAGEPIGGELEKLLDLKPFVTNPDGVTEDDVREITKAADETISTIFLSTKEGAVVAVVIDINKFLGTLRKKIISINRRGVATPDEPIPQSPDARRRMAQPEPKR